MRKVLALFVLLAGCTPDFQSPSQVLDLRVLAVKTDPPEAQFDDTHVQPVHVSVLAVDPVPRAPMKVTARACWPTDSLRCDAGYAFDAGLVGTDFILPVPQDVIATALANDKLKGLNGIRLQLELTVDDGDPAGPVVAQKVAVFSRAGTTVPNQLPFIDSIELTQDAQPVGALVPGDTLQLRVGVPIGLRPVLRAGSRETYTTVDLNGNPVTLTEQPRYAFFGQGAGVEFDRDTAYEPLDGVAPPEGLTRITANVRGAGALWIVVRDGRGGETWVTQPIVAN